MQNRNERPGSNWGLSSSPSPYLPQFLVGLIAGSFLFFGLYRWVLSDRYRSQVPRQFQQAQVRVPDHVLRNNNRRGLSRRISSQNSENPQPSFLRVETSIDSNPGLASVESTFETSDLLIETRIDVAPEVSPQISVETDSKEISVSIKKSASKKKKKTKIQLPETLSPVSEIQEMSVLIKKSASKKKKKARILLPIVSEKDFLELIFAGKVNVLTPPPEKLTEDFKNQHSAQIKANNEFTEKDIKMGKLISELRQQPKDPIMQSIIKEIGLTSSKYATTKGTYRERKQEKFQLEKKLVDFFKEKLPLTQSKNLSCYYLAHFAGEEYMSKQAVKGERQTNDHHFSLVSEYSRVTSPTDHFGHSMLHWAAFLETGDRVHLRPAQSQQALRSKERNTWIKQSASPQIEISKSTSDQEVKLT